MDNPVSPYVATKKACKLLVHTYRHLYKLNMSAVCFFTVYGPRGRPDMTLYQFVDKISRSVEIQKFGDGRNRRDYTYISNIVDSVVRSIDRPYPYQVFNLGKGDGTSLNEFIGIVEKHMGMTAKVRQLPDQAGDVPYTCASVEKARVLLEYKAMVLFDKGIHRTVEWYNGWSVIGSGNGSYGRVVVPMISTKKAPLENAASEKTQCASLELTRKTPVVKSEAGMSQAVKSGLSRVVSVDLISQHRTSKEEMLVLCMQC